MIHYKLLVMRWPIFTLSVQLIYCASLHSSKCPKSSRIELIYIIAIVSMYISKKHLHIIKMKFEPFSQCTSHMTYDDERYLFFNSGVF